MTAFTLSTKYSGIRIPRAFQPVLRCYGVLLQVIDDVVTDFPVCRREQSDNQRQQQRKADADEQETVADGPSWLCCAVCTTPVTTEQDLREVAGSPIHHKSNPSGMQFTIACYSQAPGGRVSGNPIAEYSWFAGCDWQYVHCRQCSAQLGWFFTGVETFYALETSAIIRCNQDS